MNSNEGKRWSDEDIRILRALWESKTKEDIAEELGRTVKSVISRATVLGLKGQENPRTGPRATKNKIIEAVKDNGPLTINCVSKIVGAHRQVCHHHILELEKKGVLKRAGVAQKTSRKGRSPNLWTIVGNILDKIGGEK